MVSGAGILIWQAYQFLRIGLWNPISFTTLLSFIGIPEFASWATYPTDWVGFHKVLSHIPASLLLMVIGFFTWLAGE
jgi:hypothetical protein